MWTENGYQCVLIPHRWTVQREKRVAVPPVSQSDAFFVSRLPAPRHVHSISYGQNEFCIPSCLRPLQTVGSQLSLPWILWFGVFCRSIILSFSLPQCHGAAFLWGNKHVGAGTCPTDTVVALVFVTCHYWHSTGFTDRALCSQRTLKICILSN